jgi:hypothetical protein
MVFKDGETSAGYFPKEEDISQTVRTILSYCDEYVRMMDYERDLDLHVSMFDLVDVAVRVLKREEYYRHFHGIDIRETKRSALICYWISVIHPFTVTDARYENDANASFFNERLAASIVVWTSFDNEAERFDDSVPATGRVEWAGGAKSFFEKLVYSLRYRNLSLDECVLLSESINPASFGQASE